MPDYMRSELLARYAAARNGTPSERFARAKESIDKQSIELIKTFEAGLDNYFNQKWDHAIKFFIKSINFEDDFPGRNTNPSQVFIDRCNYFKQNPPDLNWDGVWIMTSK